MSNTKSNLMLELKDITKFYTQGTKTVDVLQQVDLEVREGELIAIIGASGCGKSTLLHIAGLLDNPNSGSIKIAGFEVKNAKESQLNSLRLRSLGFVYQYHHLLNDFRAIENIILPQLLANIPKHIALENSLKLLAQLGLTGKENNFPGELSGGEQQRVAIARAFANNPKIILADEPTGNLDHATAKEVFETLVSNTKQNKVATVIVTHNHELAAKMDTVYLLKENRLVKQ